MKSHFKRGAVKSGTRLRLTVGTYRLAKVAGPSLRPQIGSSWPPPLVPSTYTPHHISSYTLTQPKAPLSLLKLTLHTGLKHQLRVHLAHSLHSTSRHLYVPGAQLMNV